ncbi:acyl-CoA synthetase [Chlorogloeopsis sp. ULAP01]|uniref:acyl-CoA synthetase n=1 Tax=Chlorogloeopsis sp. ULAP01 TaxID=3056483 RepID=UPI0025AA7674|nr:acyl-CoA synthetase [Chlorogloeopsis sp. ULAP01]MDM9379122.1 acyl-CoA synthetase [Chlorogloeopsis sp. ULAP01]
MKSITNRIVIVCALIAVPSAGIFSTSLQTQANSSQQLVQNRTTQQNQQKWNNNELTTITVKEAWQKSGKNYDSFVRMVQQLVALSVEKRGYQLRPSKEAGKEIGQMIRKQAENDPDQLLYAIVDSSVREYAKKYKL